MLKLIESHFPARLFSLCLLLLFLFACGSKDRYAGTYKADAADWPKPDEATVELKENGEGTWRVGDEEISFSWDMKESELRVNTRGGGIILGSLKDGVIRITLPNSRTMAFKKIH